MTEQIEVFGQFDVRRDVVATASENGLTGQIQEKRQKLLHIAMV